MREDSTNNGSGNGGPDGERDRLISDRIRAGNEALLDDIQRKELRQIARYLSRFLGSGFSKEDREEVLQDVLFAVWTRYDHKRGPLLTFMRAIAYRRMIDCFQRNGRIPYQPIDDLDVFKSTCLDPHYQMECREAAIAVGDFLKNDILTEDEGRALTAWRANGMRGQWTQPLVNKYGKSKLAWRNHKRDAQRKLAKFLRERGFVLETERGGNDA